MHNGQGGLDWAGLDAVVAWLGVDDVDRLLHQLLAIKTHRKPAEDEETDTPTE